MMNSSSPDANAGDSSQAFDRFINWFRQLDDSDQQDLMRLVYDEHRIRNVVRTFSGMPIEQRQAVFQRLGLPNEVLSRIPPPSAQQIGDVEVEWKEWDSSRTP
jgi:hypothetical protein